jgi:hypothetical protein
MLDGDGKRVHMKPGKGDFPAERHVRATEAHSILL